MVEDATRTGTWRGEMVKKRTEYLKDASLQCAVTEQPNKTTIYHHGEISQSVLCCKTIQP